MLIRTDVGHSKRQVIEQLTALRDEASLRLHLLSVDARQRWNELEKQIAALERRADRDAGNASDALQQTAQSLTRALNAFMTSHMNHSVGLLTTVRSLMTTHVCTCAPQDSLARAAQLMWDNDCCAIPVVSSDNVVGMITDRDICMATYTQGASPSTLRVDSAMSKDLSACGPDDSIGAVLATMSDKRVRRLPVLSAERRLLGIVALADVARWARSLTNPAVEAAVTDTLAAISALSPQKLHAAAAD